MAMLDLQQLKPKVAPASPAANDALTTGKKLAAKPTKPRKPPKAGGGLAAALAQKQLVP